MSNEKDALINLIVRLIKKNLYKSSVITFLSPLEVLEETLMLKLIFPAMQQNLI